MNKGRKQTDVAQVQDIENGTTETIDAFLNENAKTNNIVKRTLSLRLAILIAMTCTFIAVVLLGVWQWNIGYTVSKQIGVVPEDAKSGSQMYDQTLQDKEVKLLMLGLIKDSKDILNSSKLVVRKRVDGTESGGDWSRDLPIEDKRLFLRSAHRLQCVNALEWVQEQPNWDVGLTRDDKNLLKVKRYEGRTAREWKEKYYQYKKHHVAQEHDEDYRLLREKEKENEELKRKLEDVTDELTDTKDELATTKELRAVDQSKLNTALAFVHDDPYYWHKVDVSHLNENWENEYAEWIEKSPTMKKHLFEKAQEAAANP